MKIFLHFIVRMSKKVENIKKKSPEPASHSEPFNGTVEKNFSFYFLLEILAKLYHLAESFSQHSFLYSYDLSRNIIKICLI